MRVLKLKRFHKPNKLSSNHPEKSYQEIRAKISIENNQFYLYKVLKKIASVMMMMMMMMTDHPITQKKSLPLISLKNLKIDQALHIVKLTR